MKNLSLICYNLVFGIVFACSVACNTNSKESAKEESSSDVNASPQAKSSSARPVHWGYDGNDGPSNWASLSPVYALCGEGKSQSPINVTQADAKEGAKWSFDFNTTSLKIAHNEHMDDILDNGHTIQVTVDEGSTFTFGDITYHLKQFHFHTPSEHTIDGRNLPMEMHMVHQSDNGKLAVVSILFEEGNAVNPNIAKIVEHLPAQKGETKHLDNVNLSLEAHLPENNQAYHYKGSLTTPPCSEDVQWLILKEKVSVTSDQVEAFSSLIGPNNRPVQALNERTIEEGNLTGEVAN